MKNPALRTATHKGMHPRIGMDTNSRASEPSNSVPNKSKEKSLRVVTHDGHQVVMEVELTMMVMMGHWIQAAAVVVVDVALVLSVMVVYQVPGVVAAAALK